MDADDNVPLALRRERRSNFGVRVKTEPDTLPEIKTPRRGGNGKRKVRFSDPGLSSNSGLTPMLRRTTLFSTPSSRRRASNPSTTTRHNGPSVPSSPSRQVNGSQCIRHVLDGRVERRLRRSALRTALDQLDSKHQRNAGQARSQITHLKNELRARDREIYELQNATIMVDTDRVWDLERQVDDLQRELREAQDQQQQQREKTTFVDWTMAARDPFEEGSRSHMDMDFGYDGEDEDMFGDATVAQLACSTPSRARHSFPTPPATSPVLPGLATPSSHHPRLNLHIPSTPASVHTHAGVQASLPDPELQARQAELESLQRETRKLTATLDSYKQLTERLSQRLPQLPSADNEPQVTASTGDNVELQVEALLQSLSDRTSSLTGLTATISSLGFPGKDASEMLTSLSAAFRTARLELEYLTPGEITLPLTSHGAEVLDLVLVQLRDLARKVKEGDEAVDEYHAIELNLRQQLDARVSAMDDLRADLTKATGLVGDKDAKIQELEVGNDRLKGAVEGYVRDMAELERLVERMEGEASEKDKTLSERQVTITDLETRLKDATSRASDLQDELEVAQATRKKHLAAVNRRSGEALALRDARVAELRDEIDRVNNALRDAHERIRRLRVDRGSVEDENRSLRGVVDGMKGELQRVLRMSEELLGGRGGEPGEPSVEDDGGDKSISPGNLLSGKLARRSSGRKRRRYDSGLGFLDEDVVDM
ncbi:hypothetical protein ACO1O0_007649 [Amphichorda felina]